MLETVFKTIVDQIFVLSGKSQYHDSSGMNVFIMMISESLPRDISPNLGYVPYVISELAAFQLLHSFLLKFFDTT